MHGGILPPQTAGPAFAAMAVLWSAMKVMPGGGRDSPEPQGVADRPLLSVDGLRATVNAGDRRVQVLREVTFELEPNATVGLTGPSGAGKTSVALAILGLLPGGQASLESGSVRLAGRELIGLSQSEYRKVRGREIGMVFQDPRMALTPVHRVGRLLGETIGAHFGWPRERIRDRTLKLLGEVGFPEPGAIASAFPLELSGGMQQRVAIALALAADPRVLILDEPTSALDAIATAEILDLIGRIGESREISVLLISHEPDVIDRMADRIVRIERGRVVDQSLVAGPGAEVDRGTGSGVDAGPGIGVDGALDAGAGRPRASAAPAEADALVETASSPVIARPSLEVRNLSASYGDRGDAPVIDGVTFSIGSGEVLGLVGQSGSGKTTVARCVLRLLSPSAGEIRLNGTDIAGLGERQLRPFRPLVSAVFQSPAASLNPRKRVGRIIEAPLIGAGLRDRSERHSRVAAALKSVDLEPTLLERRPGELSGGQQQRVALARALVSEPQVLVCDEPFTALDHPLRDRLVRLLIDLQKRHGLACLFIAHDLDVVERIADRIAVMKEGRIIEAAPTAEILHSPVEDFTRNLLRARL